MSDDTLTACRSLSEVPKGLRPIRTTSGKVITDGGHEQAPLKGFVARLRWARQQSLEQRQGATQHGSHAGQPTAARVMLLM